MDKTEFLKEVLVGGKSYGVYDINRLEEKVIAAVSRLPFSIKILVENLLRKLDGRVVREEDLTPYRPVGRNDTRYRWKFPTTRAPRADAGFLPVWPAVVDLAAHEGCHGRDGGAIPKKINPLVAGGSDHRSFRAGGFITGPDDCAPAQTWPWNTRRNGERYTFLKWGPERVFDNFQWSVPPPIGYLPPDQSGVSGEKPSLRVTRKAGPSPIRTRLWGLDLPTPP